MFTPLDLKTSDQKFAEAKIKSTQEKIMKVCGVEDWSTSVTLIDMFRV